MRVLILTFSFVLFFNASPLALASPVNSYSSEIPYPPKSGYIEQRTDHFSFPSSDLRFNQLYLYEDKWYKPGGPIFFYCGNEGSIEVFWNNTGFLFEIAPSFNAFIVFGEHRYYGKSLPFPRSFTQPYIQYLSIEQALADYAYLIGFIKTKFNLEKSPVIAFGGSYGGELAAFARVWYPHIFHGALASSSPVRWTSGIGNIHGFFESTTKAYSDVNPKCIEIIRAGYDQLLTLAKKREPGFRQITERLNLCSPINTIQDFNWMLKWTRNAFVMMSMMNYPYETSFMAPLPANPVNVSCKLVIESGSSDPIAAIRSGVSVMYPISQSKCFPYRQQYIECADITGCGLGNDSYAWDFQSCTEIHLYDDSTSTPADMFPSLPLSKVAVEDYCLHRWGVKRADNQLATFFSDDVWRTTSNIIFSNGDLDPWRNGGILQDVSDSVVAYLIQGGAHHLDLRASNSADPNSVRTTRQLEVETISKWLKELHHVIVPN